MTKEQVIELAKQAGMGGMLTDIVCNRRELERFAKLVRNAALEDAAKVCFAMPAPISCNRVEANLCDVMTAQCANEIRNLKEPTP